MREPKKMALTVLERFGAQGLLPEKANFSNMKLIRVLREELSLSTEEIETIGLVDHGNGKLTWDDKKADEVLKEIGFDPKMYVVVMEALQKLDDAEELEEKHLSLYEKFVEVKTDAKAE